MISPQNSESVTQAGEPVGVRAAQLGYEPPAIRRLGSLSELTRGGTTGPSDGMGYAGAMGSI